MYIGYRYFNNSDYEQDQNESADFMVVSAFQRKILPTST